jgi:hypothetical protein
VPRNLTTHESAVVRFTYDVSGQLEVDVTVQSTRHKANLVITKLAGELSEGDIKAALKKMAARGRREHSCAKPSGGGICYGTRRGARLGDGAFFCSSTPRLTHRMRVFWPSCAASCTPIWTHSRRSTSRDKAWPWSVLGVDRVPPTTGDIRRAYARALKVIDQAKDIEGFAALRQAYEGGIAMRENRTKQGEIRKERRAEAATKTEGDLADADVLPPP